MSFQCKQKREPGNHLGKTLPDVNMLTSQPVYSALVLSLVPASDATIFPFLSEPTGENNN